MASGVKTGGRKKGTPNKTTALLKDAILQAAEDAGGKEGLVGYLTAQAKENPGPFLSLLGKVLPVQLNAEISYAADRMTDDELAAIAIAGSARASAPTLN